MVSYNSDTIDQFFGHSSDTVWLSRLGPRLCRSALFSEPPCMNSSKSVKKVGQTFGHSSDTEWPAKLGPRYC